ncbi:MAG TPA: LPS assembly lipoprotein LptE [Spirochaetota bacterium]|nr:hypothetical protein [Spirochaetota bacterium]HOD14529.1 LPS assembly lipoprotein LptE [Spirochaetota bacterium]HPG49572.1 LPS assembly lipoprotein LptE [Spirochaetota bacterium]HPN13030.1 LPS assembly lipoprotein LptE [Spirochaetota bacterium]HQL80894.1 LPS assembly lipoprotein LptE [Spirochaetota bacterium]
MARSFIIDGRAAVLARVIAIMLAIWVPGGCASGGKEGDSTARKFIESFDGEPVVPRAANRIYIAPPIDATGSQDLAEKLLIKVREGLSLDGRLGVDSEELHADLRLEIRITKYLVERIAFDEIGRAVKKRLWITADVKCVRLDRKRKMILYEPGVQAFRVFSDLAMPIEPESQAREYVLDDLAGRITAKTVTGWYTDLLTDIEKRKK